MHILPPEPGMIGKNKDMELSHESILSAYQEHLCTIR